jgi:N utilization substance protein A
MIDIKALNAGLKMIEEEKRIPAAKVLEAVEAALGAAYKKEFGQKDQNIRCILNMETGEMSFVQVKLVVDENTVFIPKDEGDVPEEGDERNFYNEEKHMFVAQAKLIKRDAEVGSEIIFPLDNPESDFGRIAAQTAKQVIMQKLREAEKESLSDEFAGKEDSIVSGTVQRVEKNLIFVDLGRVTGVLPKEEQIRDEAWRPGEKIRAYLYSFNEAGKGLSLRLSRTHPRFLIELFKQESPEIRDGQVEIKYVVREPGKRAKMAVVAHDSGLDPIGSCVGPRGARIMTVMKELHGERIDIIEWSDDIESFIVESLSPAEISEVEVDTENKVAKVFVKQEEYAKVIGKSGQNVRLASKLTQYRIDVEVLDAGKVENIETKEISE